TEPYANHAEVATRSSRSARLDLRGDRGEVGGPEGIDRPPQALVERRVGLEADQLAGPAGVEGALRLPVGLPAVPDGPALEAREPGDRLGQIPDPGLRAGADVDRVGDVEPLAAEHQTPGSVVHVEELARRLARAPQDDLRLPLIGGDDVLVDHRR